MCMYTLYTTFLFNSFYAIDSAYDQIVYLSGKIVIVLLKISRQVGAGD